MVTKAPNHVDLIKRAIALFTVAIVTACGVKPTQAQLIEPPPGQPGAPQTTTSGGSRPITPSCLQSLDQTETFTAIASLHSVGLTRRDRPTVWVYLPQTQAKTLEFSLFDQQHQGVYQTSIDINNQSGLVAIALPSSAPALQPNQPYEWTAALVCDVSQRTNDWVTGGWIEHRAFDSVLQLQLNRAAVSERVRLYVNAGFWYEAVDTYLRSKQSSQIQLSAIWTDLLSSPNYRSPKDK